MKKQKGPKKILYRKIDNTKISTSGSAKTIIASRVAAAHTAFWVWKVWD